MSEYEALREKVARALYEEPGRARRNWDDYPLHHREHWLADADRIIPIIAADYAAVVAEKRRAQEACQQMGMRIAELEALQTDIDDFRNWATQ